MMKNVKRNYSAIAIACSLALSAPLASFAAATAATPQVISGTLTSPTYPAGSVQLALFQQLNQARNECGFPALQENTILDQAAEAHQKYQVANSTGADTEIAGKPGFTGATAIDRAVHFGIPSNAVGGGASTDQPVLAPDADTEAQVALDFGLMGDVYSATNLLTPVNLVGVGAGNGAFDGGQELFVSIDVFDTATQPIASSPITFPCAGFTNVALTNSQSLSIPASGDSQFATVGPEVFVMGSSSDHIVLTSATMTSSTGGSFTLALLDSANDPNKLLQPFQSVAYVTANDLNNVQPSTAYAVSINGTVNGVPFSRNFTMTTENPDAPLPDPTNPQPSPTPTPTPTPAPAHTPRSIRGALPVEIPGTAPIHATTPVFSVPIKGTLPVDIPGRAPIDAPSPIFRPGGLPPGTSPAHSSGIASIKGVLPVDIPGRAPIDAPSPIFHPGGLPGTSPAHSSGTGSIKGALPVDIPGRAPIHATTPVIVTGASSIKGTLPVDIPGKAPIHAPSPIFHRGGVPGTSPAHSSGTASVKGALPVDVPGRAPIHATTPVIVTGASPIKGTLPVDVPGKAPIHAPSPILFPGTAADHVSDTTSRQASEKSSAPARTSTTPSADSTAPISVGQR